MLPIVLSSQAVRAGLAGSGKALARRLRLLDSARLTRRAVFEDREPDARELSQLNVLFIAGWDEGRSRALSTAARKAGVLVNVEDMPKLCDFHVPAQVRRGDLLLTVSTGGRSPGLAARVREMLESVFGPEWEKRLDKTAIARARWRAAGASQADVRERTRALIEGEGWLP